MVVEFAVARRRGVVMMIMVVVVVLNKWVFCSWIVRRGGVPDGLERRVHEAHPADAEGRQVTRKHALEGVRQQR